MSICSPTGHSERFQQLQNQTNTFNCMGILLLEQLFRDVSNTFHSHASKLIKPPKYPTFFLPHSQRHRQSKIYCASINCRCLDFIFFGCPFAPTNTGMIAWRSWPWPWSEEEDMRFFSLTNFELYKRKTEQPTISRDLTKDLLLQFNLGHAWIVEKRYLEWNLWWETRIWKI
jgi:hypothetical protein